MSEVKIAPIPDLGQRTDEITIYAGPCSVESAEQFDEVAECIADLGLTWIRGGAFKPRTNPHSFQGLGEEALKIMKSAGDRYNLKTLTEVMDSAHCQLVADYVDGLQVGARNFQNFSLLKRIGEVTADTHQMVLYKRGFAGHHRRVARRHRLHHRSRQHQRGALRARHPHLRDGHALHAGHRGGAGHPQAVAVPGVHRRVAPARTARLGAVAGKGGHRRRADSLMIEVHPNPPVALSDGPQQLTPGSVPRAHCRAARAGRLLGQEDRVAACFRCCRLK